MPIRQGLERIAGARPGIFRDKDQQSTNKWITLADRITQEFEATMLREMEDGASLNEIELRRRVFHQEQLRSSCHSAGRTPRKDLPMSLETKEVSLRELVAAMAKSKDEDTFRWFQDSVINARGEPQATVTYRVTMGQVRQELGMSPADPHSADCRTAEQQQIAHSGPSDGSQITS